MKRQAESWKLQETHPTQITPKKDELEKGNVN